MRQAFREPRGAEIRGVLSDPNGSGIKKNGSIVSIEPIILVMVKKELRILK